MTLVSRASAKSSVIVASGPMNRSTEECEMSRSCHSATFSSAGRHIAAHHPREAGEVLGQHRVALVRHRRAALLPRREIFLGLEHLGALQVADLGRQPLDRRGDDAQRREEHRVPVARDDLGRDRLDRQPELGRDMLLHPADRCWRRCRPRRRSRRSRRRRAPRPAARGCARIRHRPGRA